MPREGNSKCQGPEAGRSSVCSRDELEHGKHAPRARGPGPRRALTRSATEGTAAGIRRGSASGTGASRASLPLAQDDCLLAGQRQPSLISGSGRAGLGRAATQTK